MEANVEIERKYIIVKPCLADMQAMEGFCFSEIEQTYLKSIPRITHRVRARTANGRTVYTETKKIRIDRVSAYEDEQVISEAEYKALLLNIADGTKPVRKTRHVFKYEEQVFEIDFYPEWHNTAIMETELSSREKKVVMPPFIQIIKEVSGIKEYSNASLSRGFPEEEKVP